MPKPRPSTGKMPTFINYRGTRYKVAGVFRKEGTEFVTFLGELGIERSVPLAAVLESA